MQTPWLIWIILSALLIALDALWRYLRFRRSPKAWATQSLIIGAIVWTSAWLIINFYVDRRLGGTEIVQSVLFGVAYLGLMLLLGQRVLRITD